MKAQLPTIQDHVSLLNDELLFKLQLFNKLHQQSWSSFTTSMIVLISYPSIFILLLDTTQLHSLCGITTCKAGVITINDCTLPAMP